MLVWMQVSSTKSEVVVAGFKHLQHSRNFCFENRQPTVTVWCPPPSPLQGPHVTDLACTPLAQRLRVERPRQLARRAWLVNTLGGRRGVESWREVLQVGSLNCTVHVGS